MRLLWYGQSDIYFVCNKYEYYNLSETVQLYHSQKKKSKSGVHCLGLPCNSVQGCDGHVLWCVVLNFCVCNTLKGELPNYIFISGPCKLLNLAKEMNNLCCRMFNKQSLSKIIETQ